MLHTWLLTVVAFCLYLPHLLAGPLQLVSTESDPDAFIQNSINVLNGEDCESATDLLITGPDALVLQRFYSTNDAITGTQMGRWRILPQRFLVVGKDPSKKTCTLDQEALELALAFTGERSGGILPYSGWRRTDGSTKDPLQIDLLDQARGAVNTYAKEIQGQNNKKNARLHCQRETCELHIGDGSKRTYKRVNSLPSQLLGEELTPIMAAQVLDPSYYLLVQEILPSGNTLFFSYDPAGHLTNVEMKNPGGKLLSWIRFSYLLNDASSQVLLTTSDARKLTYQFVGKQLTQVYGSHCIPVTYEYDGPFLVKTVLPEGRFVEMVYQDGKVQALKGPQAESGKPEIAHTFSYGEGYTDVFDAMGVKTRYRYDERLQLTKIEKYDSLGALFRVEQKFWGTTPSDAGLLLAKTVGDGEGRIRSYRSFVYDPSGNVLEERVYGNLTGKQEVSLQVSSDGKLLDADEEECHVKTFGYSADGFHLLTRVGDAKGNQTLYAYKPGTNLLCRKWIYDKGTIKKRTFLTYNTDGVCIKIVEDDGCQEKESQIESWSATERHIKEIRPKTTLPGVGLPEEILEKAWDLKTGKEILIKKLLQTYDEQSHLLSCDTYDAEGKYAFTEKRSYTSIGKIASEKDALGREVFYTYDGLGNEISRDQPDDKRSVRTWYNFHNLPVQIVEKNGDESITLHNSYDILGRKIASTDRFGQTTQYEYDSFHRLTQLTHPEVLDEYGQPIRPTFRYVYDIFGNVLEVTDPKGFITKKTYTLRGSPAKVTYPDGSVEIFKYDPEGSLHRSLTRQRVVTVYEYDYLGRPIYEESSSVGETGVTGFLNSKSYQYNGFRCTYEKQDDQIKRYSFDAAGRLIKVTQYGLGQTEKSPDTQMTEYSYDAFGRIQQSKVWFDRGPQDYALECYSYDLAGNVLEKRVTDAAKSTLLQKFFTYNLHGQCEEEYVLENGTKQTLVKTVYNSQREPVSYLDGRGQETRILIDNQFVNALGQTVVKKTLVNPVGVQTEMEFDALGRICSISKKDPFGALLSSEKYLYDALGNKAVEIHDRIVNGNVVDSERTERVYGPMGRLEEETLAAGSSLSTKIGYEYNLLGQMVSKNQAGSLLLYTYNRDGNLHKIESSPTDKKLHVANTYSYDRLGNITSAYALHGKSVQRYYNPLNQLRKELFKDGEGSYSLVYSYDRKGRLKSIILPDFSKIAYTYDAVFCRKVERLSSQGELLYTHSYCSYDLQGQLLSENQIGDAGSCEYTYDLTGHVVASKNAFFEEKVERDALGRITAVQGDSPNHYVYNDLSQVISEKEETHAYDSLDNRIQNNQEELVYNALNQLVAKGKTEFSYDSQGNLLRKILDGEETRFESNALSQLTTIERADQTALTFSYDPFGRLFVEKKLDIKGKNKRTLSTTRYFYFGQQEIGTLSDTGALETLKIPGIHGGALSPRSVAFEIQGSRYVPIHDLSGNVVRLVDPDRREIRESYEYTAFGKVSVFNAAGKQEKHSLVGNPWQFAEKRLDEKSGLILFGLRLYDPNLGRWIQSDPAGGLDGPNVYAYLHNNPINHLDRFGLATESGQRRLSTEEYMYGEVEPHCYCEKHRSCKRGGDIGKTAGSPLPKIVYNDTFEKENKDLYVDDVCIKKDYYDDSTCYDLSADGRPNLPDGLGIGFINGIWNDAKGARESAEYVSRLSGGVNVHGVYNATHGNDKDLAECVLGLNYVATEPVRQLHKMWNSFFEKSSANAKFLMICHSQGALHVRNALLDYPPELRERILVVAIAPAAYIYHETCASVIHYRAEIWRDFVPRLDRAGAEREKDYIVTLPSAPKTSVFDHTFMSLTYRARIQEHILNYIRSGGTEF